MKKKKEPFETVDSLIKKLEEVKSLHGGEIEVMFYHGDGAYEKVGQDEAYMEIIPASKIYPEDKMFILKVGEDTDFGDL